MYIKVADNIVDVGPHADSSGGTIVASANKQGKPKLVQLQL
jgi:excinuclease UvrABC ATPase subunit